jgi:hypothetical protein
MLAATTVVLLFGARLLGVAEPLFESSALQTGVCYQMNRSGIAGFDTAIRLSASRAEAVAVHCVQAIQGAPGLSYFIISASGDVAH